MTNKGFLFIFNQAAGKKRKKDINALILKKARAINIDKDDVYLVYSTSPVSSQFLIDRFAERYPTGVVVACGGDGTVLTIGNLIMHTDLIFAILPMGTGNDLYRGLYGKRSIADQLTHIFTGKTGPTDAIFIPEIDQYVMNIVSVGVDSSVVSKANELKETNKLFQKYTYMASIPSALADGTDFDIELKAKLNDEIQPIVPSPYILAATCNGQMYGGGFRVNPNGQIDDGKLELVYAEHLPMRKILSSILKFFSGDYEDVDAIHKLSCDWVHYESKTEQPLIVNCDGETYHLPSFTCQMKKHAYTRIL